MRTPRSTRPAGRWLAMVAVLGVTLMAATPVRTAAPRLATVTLPGGSTISTHGPEWVEPAGAPRPKPVADGDVVCASPRSPRFEVLVAYAADDRVRDPSTRHQLRDAVVAASAFLDAEARAAHPGARARLPVRCDAAGRPAVDVVELPLSVVGDDFAAIAGALAQLGYRDRRTKYVVWYDDCVPYLVPGVDDCTVSGQGSIDLDDRPTKHNRNNRGPDYAIQYGVPALSSPDWFVILHEIGHTMGAVQPGAPHESGHHCTDGSDVMCGRVGLVCAQVRFDCNRDDYFDPAPEPGSYLDTHWNLAARDNAFIVHD